VGRDEDALAFCRIEREYQNLLICELPNGDFAQTILRQFYFSSFMLLFWEQAQNSSDATVAAVAGKAIKEAKYHRRHCGEWVIRLGDGTDESARRMQASCEILEPYLGELFNNSYGSLEISQSGVLPDRSLLQEPWLIDVMEVFQAANLNIPDLTHAHKGGREGRHTEAMGHLLAQLQYMQRSFPDMAW
jgi:ring-1,2-phenylacetyl-CoA epoxidase subunit PaaC